MDKTYYPNIADEEAVFQASQGRMDKASASCPFRIRRETIDWCREQGHECIFEIQSDFTCDELEEWIKELKQEVKDGGSGQN